MTELFQVWRRLRLSRQPWQKVPGLAPLPKRDAYLATESQEWIASATDWEYSVWPVGQRPSERESFFEGYRTKVMKPQ